MEHVFESLKEAGFKNVLFNPSEADFYRYFEAETIIIKQLISKSPLIKKESKISIEKFCIDVISDKVLNYFYEGAEIPYILEDVFQNYKNSSVHVRDRMFSSHRYFLCFFQSRLRMTTRFLTAISMNEFAFWKALPGVFQ